MTDNMQYDMSYTQPEAPAQTTPAPEKAKEETVYSLKESIFALVFSFAGYFFLKLFLLSYAGIGAAIFMLCLAFASALFMKLSGAKQSRYSAAYFITAVLFSLNIGITSNGLIQFLDLVFASSMFSLWTFAVNNPSYRGADDSMIYCLKEAVFGKSFGNMGKCPGAVMSLTKKSRAGKNIQSALIGIVIAVPVTALSAALLSSADDGFAKIMDAIANGILNNFFSGILKYLFGLPLSFLIFGMLFSAERNRENERINLYACARNTAAAKVAPAVMVYSSVIPLCFVYVIFFFSQLSYFTSAFRNILPEEFSAAEYARKGFFELCAVSVINLFVITAMNLFCKYNDTEDGGRKRPAALSFFTALISAFTLILIATAQSKMAMYIRRFGLTRMRVYTSWFMIVLAVLFVLIIIRQFRKFNIAKIGSVIFTVMLALLSFAQTDALIAEYNIRAYESGCIGNISFDDLSSDAVYAAAAHRNSASSTVRGKTASFITYRSETAASKNWHEKSLSEFIAENLAAKS